MTLRRGFQDHRDDGSSNAAIDDGIRAKLAQGYSMTLKVDHPFQGCLTSISNDCRHLLPRCALDLSLANI